MLQVSINSLLYIWRYTLDKRTFTKYRNGNNTVITSDLDMVLHYALTFITVYQCVNFHSFLGPLDEVQEELFTIPALALAAAALAKC